MANVTFYKGLRVIGGTFVAVETQQAVCMFDFGFTVNDRADARVSLRPGHIPQDTVRSGQLPAADGIYEEAAAKEIGVVPFGKTEKPHFFVISHMHIDHMGGLDMLDPQIPVYMSEDSLKLYRRLEAQNELTFRGHENCIGIPYGESFEVGDIKIKVVPVDHDCVGACGFLIETPDGTICYTGDYRFHGYHPEVTRAFATECAGADLLITEGVTVSFSDVDMLSLTEPTEAGRTEYTLLDEVSEICAKTDGLVIVNPYNRNVERVHELNKRLANEGRTLVMDCAQADYVATFWPQDAIHVYAPTVHDRPLPANAVLVEREQLLENPASYALQLDYSDLYELFDIQSVTKEYLHIDGAPLGDYDPSYKKMVGQLEAMGITYHYMSLGGHAKPYYIRWMVDTIAPRILVPLHSQRPEQVASKKASRRILPTEGETIVLEKE